MVPTHTCDCGAPALSTTISFAGVVSGDPSAGFAGVPFCQPPSVFVDQRLTSASSMSPTTTSAALLATKFCFQNASSASRVIALFEASVPIST